MKQYRLFNNKFRVDYHPNWLDQDEGNDLFNTLNDLLENKNTRSSLLFGDDIKYTITYRGHSSVSEPNPWPDFLLPIKNKMQMFIYDTYQDEIDLNVCAIQKYPSGRVGINPHRDKEMTSGTMICGLSLGQTRVLEFSKWQSPPFISIPLESHSLYLMMPPTNEYFAHSIKKDASKNARISLTFRNYTK